MKTQNSKSVVPNKKQRQALMPRWALLGVALSVSAALVLLYPKQSIIEKVEHQHNADPLAASYLANLLKKDPNNVKVQLLLGEQKLNLGELGESAGLLQSVVSHGTEEQRLTAMLLQLKLFNAQLAKLPSPSKQRAVVNKQQREVIENLMAVNLSNSTLVELINTAMIIDAPDLAATLYQKLLKQSGPQDAQWYAAQARSALGRGYYQLASDLYLAARHKANTLEQQRNYFLEGLNVLLADSRFTQVMKVADKELGNLSHDEKTLTTLVQIARAANDLPHATDYMLLLPQTDNFQYDEEYFELAWQTFLGTRNLPYAYKIAEMSVKQLPDNLMWRERMAQVAEWNNKPEVAIQHWRILMRAGNEAALPAIFRLAPGLNDHETRLEAWQTIAKQRALDDKEWKQIVELYELLGKPSDGAKFLASYNADQSNALLLGMTAQLQENAGDDNEAQKTWLALINKHGATTERVLHTARLLFQRSAFPEAQELLYKHRIQAGGNNSEYWHMLATLAWQLQKYNEAREAYQQLTTDSNATAEDMVRLVTLQRRDNTAKAVETAELVWRKFAEPDMLFFALEYYAEQRNLAAQRRLFDSVDSKKFNTPAAQVRFLLLRGQFHLANNRPNEALADHRQAVAADPESSDAQVALLWMLINRKDEANLRKILPQVASKGRADPAYWGVLAAAYQTINQPGEAVRYYSRQLRNSNQDYLWMLNYADALEQSGQAGLAWRVRQQAWRDVKRDKDIFNKGNSPQMVAAARILIQSAPGDPSLALVRKLMRKEQTGSKKSSQESDQEQSNDNAISELLLSWATSTEQNISAKTWLWQSYSRALMRPLWADAAVALAENDTKKLDQLITEQADALPVTTRHEIARATKQFELARNISFNAFANNPYSDELHARFSEDMLPGASRLGFEIKSERFGPIKQLVGKTTFDFVLSDKLILTGKVSSANQSSTDNNLFVNLPKHDRNVELGFKLFSSLGETSAAIHQRYELDNVMGVRLNHAFPISQRIKVDFGYAYRNIAKESAATFVAAAKNQLDINMLYQISKTEYLRLQPIWSEFYGQNGNYLGSGKIFNWEIGHRVRTEYPDVSVRLAGSHASFNRDGTADLASAKIMPSGIAPEPSFFLPEKSSNYQLCAGLGESARNTYSSAMRPYADFCASRNSVYGTSYNGMVGLTTSISSRDLLNVELSQSRATTGYSGTSREIMFRYQHLLNRK